VGFQNDRKQEIEYRFKLFLGNILIKFHQKQLLVTKNPNDSHTGGTTFRCDWVFGNEELRLTAVQWRLYTQQYTKLIKFYLQKIQIWTIIFNKETHEHHICDNHMNMTLSWNVSASVRIIYPEEGGNAVPRNDSTHASTFT